MLQIFDPGDTYTLAAGCDVNGFLPPFVHSLTNQVIFKFKYDFLPTGLTNSVAIQFRFNSTSQTLRRNLQVVNTSSKSGYVTSPGYDGKRGYPNYCNSFAIITPPPGHSVMISFSRMDIERSDYCSYDSLKLTKLTPDGETDVWRKCGGENVMPRVYNSSLRLVFVSDMYLVKTGFKMFFTFHPYSETPSETEAGFSTVLFHTTSRLKIT
ncbi:hypothetical protein C0Q70_11777 [Pomacea canaliculata]|uniref:CUB domain-containing protein n=1 Tax=Pomacea canaliculata TaxID=400727 RepID=A0A2T7P6Y3_POMCA|nr:hypothetical protein C0Q70_11777 [Pomacea canaliculata]